MHRLPVCEIRYPACAVRDARQAEAQCLFLK